MIDYSIEIINSCDVFFVPDTKHFGVKNIQRIGNFDLIFETFLHNPQWVLSNKISITLWLYVMKNTLLYNI